MPETMVFETPIEITVAGGETTFSAVADEWGLAW